LLPSSAASRHAQSVCVVVEYRGDGNVVAGVFCAESSSNWEGRYGVRAAPLASTQRWRRKLVVMKSIKIAANDNVFVLSGAGISVESGLPAFRSNDGLWAGSRIEDVCTPEAWERDPWKVWAFYAARREGALSVKPNPAHIAIASLDSLKSFFLCTQNVDNLHEAGGSKHVHHMHGDLFKSRCSDNCSPAIHDVTIYKSLDEVPRCHCGALMRPHITFFGEVPMGLEVIERKLDKATVLLVVGTSGTVHPAAGFVQEANRNGARTIYAGLESPLNRRQFSEVYLGSASELTFAIQE
jgi:NAD-dependent deacetylase